VFALFALFAFCFCLLSALTVQLMEEAEGWEGSPRIDVDQPA
jgi:hypothetical protein